MNEDPLIQEWTDRIDTELVRLFSRKDISCHPLERAMEYTLLAGGKRLRPLLTLIVCHEFGGSAAAALPFSLASECLHTYSLIHDDLPSMDDDPMRRGKPTNHVAFGEANAILAGDALQAEAFSILIKTPHEALSPATRLTILGEFADAVGRAGMVAGQVMDLAQEGKPTNLDRLRLLHQRKTGCLLRFCVRLGAYLAAVGQDRLQILTDYAESLGLLFQVVDDLLDTEATSEALGKTAGKDAHRQKATFPALMGPQEAHEYADGLLQKALETAGSLDTKGDLLSVVARFVRQRAH